MPTRSERRRRERAGRRPAGPLPAAALIRPRELIILAVLGGALLAGFLAFLLLRGGDGDSSPSAAASPLIPTTPDEIAIESLARQAVESLPRGEWPLLYDSFTPEFQQRCSREEFVAAGEAGAQEQGDQLPLIHFVRLEDVVFTGDTAKGIIVGEITGQGEYRLRSAYQKVEGAWKLTPTDGTEGCQSFDRLATPAP